jgi:hypothetical protein
VDAIIEAHTKQAVRGVNGLEIKGLEINGLEMKGLEKLKSSVGAEQHLQHEHAVAAVCLLESNSGEASGEAEQRPQHALAVRLQESNLRDCISRSHGKEQVYANRRGEIQERMSNR